MYPSYILVNSANEFFSQFEINTHIIWRRIYTIINNHLQSLTQNDKNAFLEIFNGYLNIYMGMEERSNDDEDEDESMEEEAEFGLKLEFMGYLVLRNYAVMKPEISNYALNNLDFIDYETLEAISLIFTNKISTNSPFVEEIFEEFYNENIHRGRRMLNKKIRRISQLVA